jgi:hypothetical protein
LGQYAFDREQDIRVGFVAEGREEVEEFGDRGASGAHERPLVSDPSNALDRIERAWVRD